MTWITEITSVENGSYFVDEQRVGPYKMWHHEHHFEQKENGVLMTDIVTYIPPLGILGALANLLFIKKQLIILEEDSDDEELKEHVKELKQIYNYLENGADKITINSHAYRNKKL